MNSEKLLQLKEITNQKDWDSLVSSKENSSILQSWNWGELQKKLGKTVNRYVAIENEKFVACFSLLIEKNRYAKLAYIPYGPLTDWQNLHQELLPKIIDLAKSVGADYLALDPQIEEKNENYEIFKKFGFVSDYRNIQARYRWSLSLDKSEEDLLLEMRKVTRYSIKQAGKKGLTTNSTEDVKFVDEFYVMFEKMSQRKGIPHPQKVYFQNLITAFNGSFRFFYSELDGKILSTALIIFAYDRAYYLWAASEDLPNSLPAQHPVIWEAVKYSKQNSFKVFDFWGLEKPYNPENLKGFDMFKTGFGGQYKELILPQHYPINKFRYFLVQTIAKTRYWWQGRKGKK